MAWDVYDSADNLLLRKGFVIQNELQIEALVRRGLYVAADFSLRSNHTPMVEAPSALRLINDANRRLARLLYNVHNETDLETKIADIVAMITRAVDVNENVALATILLNRSAGIYSVRHCIDSAIVCLLIIREMAIPKQEVANILAAAVTMNVGMLRHQEQLQSRASHLTEEDRTIIRNHPQIGMRLLKQAGVKNETWLRHVLMHHECEDGNGYPFGILGADIPVGTKIISIADRYCAKISPRAYRKALFPNAALRKVLLEEKQTIDQSLATPVMRALGIYPPGTFVKLINGETGIVTRKGQSTTTPIVHSLIGPRNAALAFPIQRDTSLPLYAVRDLVCESKAAINISMQQLWGEEASL
ncbi:HD-GYP domain-containing protein [Herbaspirillum sp. RV1423]|uniref:HD-GYP domain-containing protein n=1 Tax=Herbaspirillum sp. RV1423 TaxID=1443993 RepID=UPI000683F99A|nr:HD domain-containing phosphohydrolase [Herbaspirillum sp. RV1423]